MLFGGGGEEDGVVAVGSDGGDGIEVGGDFGDGLDEAEGGFLMRMELAGGGDVFVGEAVLAGDVDAVAEVGADLLEAEAFGVAVVPRGAFAATVGDPEEGGGEIGGVLQAEPDIAIEDHGGPGEGLGVGGGFVDEHDEVVEAGAGGVAGEVGGAAVGEGDGGEVGEDGVGGEGLVFVVGRVGEEAGVGGGPAEGGDGEAAGAVGEGGEVEDGVGAIGPAAGEAGDAVAEVEGAVVGVDGEDFGDLCAGVGGAEGKGVGVLGGLPVGIGSVPVGRAVGLRAEGEAEEVAAEVGEEDGKVGVNLLGGPGGEGVGGDGAAAGEGEGGGEVTAGLGEGEGGGAFGDGEGGGAVDKVGRGWKSAHGRGGGMSNIAQGMSNFQVGERGGDFVSIRVL